MGDKPWWRRGLYLTAGDGQNHRGPSSDCDC